MLYKLYGNIYMTTIKNLRSKTGLCNNGDIEDVFDKNNEVDINMHIVENKYITHNIDILCYKNTMEYIQNFKMRNTDQPLTSRIWVRYHRHKTLFGL